jgi:hypothetical protein
MEEEFHVFSRNKWTFSGIQNPPTVAPVMVSLVIFMELSNVIAFEMCHFTCRWNYNEARSCLASPWQPFQI